MLEDTLFFSCTVCTSNFIHPMHYFLERRWSATNPRVHQVPATVLAAPLTTGPAVPAGRSPHRAVVGSPIVAPPGGPTGVVAADRRRLAAGGRRLATEVRIPWLLYTADAAEESRG